MKISDMKSKQIYITLPKHKQDLTGKIFGRLVVLKFNYYNRHYFWLCKCECGEEVSIREDSLLTNNTRSCGCLQREHASSKRYKDYPTAFNNLFSQYRHNAEVRNIVFTLSREFMFKLTQENCYYCGNEPSNIKKTHSKDVYIYSGIDRIDSSKGYTEDNVVACCKICNYAKGIESMTNFSEWIVKVYNYLNNKKDVKKYIA
jgi:hypothetical protein